MRSISFSKQIKGGFRAAFFSLMCCVLNVVASEVTPVEFVPTFQPGVDVSGARQLADSPVWQALMHAEGEHSQIEDPGYFTSGRYASVQAELQDALIQLRKSDVAWRCRFPARAVWLSRQLNLPEPDLTACPDLQEFLQRAPLAHLDLIFASETLSEPSSMMGHIFLKVSGRNATGALTQHAITFYTDANTWNIPKLFVDSTLIGKEGYFALSPYADQVDTYVRKEQRGLWEYRIKLSEEQRALVQLHIWELKPTKFLYFFQRYNCATLVNYILALAGGDAMFHGSDLWLTPKDVVKRAHAAGLIGQTTVLAPSSWLVRNVNDGLDAPHRDVVKKAVETSQLDALFKSSPDQNAFLSLELAQAYNQYLRDQRRKSDGPAALDGAALNQHQRSHYPDHQLEAAAFKDPVYAGPDSQWSITLQRSEGANHVLWRFLPVSHGLDDDNRNYLSENELKLLEVTARQTLGTGQWRLEQLDVYAIQSLLPTDSLMGGLAGQFRISSSRNLMGGWTDKRIWHVVGAVGKAWRIHPDMDVFALIGGGGYWQQSIKPVFNPKVGVIVREVFDMKTRWQFAQLITPDLAKPVMEMELAQTKYLGRDLALTLSWVRRQGMNRMSDSYAMSWRKLF